MTTTIATKIATKSEQALASLNGIRAKASTLAFAEGFTSAADWASFANTVAEAEGEAHAWARLQMTANYFTREGKELTTADVQEVALELLSEGADDTWSGRGNDVRRARFDGIRRAVSAIRYL